MPALRIEGVGLIGPGLPAWSSAIDILRGAAPLPDAAAVLPAPDLLPPNERRRCGRNVRLALAAGLQAVAKSGRDARDFAAVFASSSGDGDTCHAICEALASDDRFISPTRFHNSVHNAPAGYWGIATGAMTAADSLCAFDASFAAGLLEAAARLAVNPAQPVLLIAFDSPYPEPLNAARPMIDAFGVALAFSAAGNTGAGPVITVDLEREAPTVLDNPGLERLRLGVPAARALPLLCRLAARQPGHVAIEYLAELATVVEVRP